MTFLIRRGEAVKQLQDQYGFDKDKSKRVLETAQEFGRNATPCEGGFVHVVYKGVSENWPYTERFSLYDHTKKTAVTVAKPALNRYTSNTPRTHKKEKLMPPAARGRTRTKPVSAPEPEPEANEDADLIASYLDKPHTATMQDYIEWAEQQVGPLDELESDRLLVLGLRLHSIFQRSEFNVTRREARRAARAVADGADEEEEVKPTRARRAGAKPAAAPAKATRARRAAQAVEEEEVEPEEVEEAPQPARPAGRRGRKPATASTAPY